MSLGEVRPFELEAALARWETMRPTTIVRHAEKCCTDAMAWLSAMDRSLRRSEHELVPRWLLECWAWGPSEDFLPLCQLPSRRVLDCGALAALTILLASQKGATTFPVQTVKAYEREVTRHWMLQWQRASVRPDWILGSVVYHEVVGVLDGSQLRVWDPTNGVWVGTPSSPGLGATVAIRVLTDGVDGERLHWEGKHIAAGQWSYLI